MEGTLLLQAAVAASAAAVTAAAPLCALLPHNRTPFFLRLSHRTLCAPPLPQTPPRSLRQSRSPSPGAAGAPSPSLQSAAPASDILSHSFLLSRLPDGKI